MSAPPGWARATFACLLTAALALLAPPVPAGPAGPPASASHGPVVLHIGDSFAAAGFAQALRPRFEALGLRYVVASKTSGFISTLPSALGLRSLLASYRPVLVLVTLGANDMTAFDPAGRGAAVRSLVASFGEVPCLWTLPPPWATASDKARALLPVIEREAAPCRTFDATPFADQIRRASDGVHPTAEGGAYWAEIFWAWLGVAEPEASPAGASP